MVTIFDLMLNNIFVYPKWYQSTQKDRYFRINFIKENCLDIGDGRISTIAKINELQPVPITKEMLTKLEIIEQIAEHRNNYTIVPTGGNCGNCNIYKDGNYVASVDYIHELQNWFYVNASKFVFNTKKLHKMLNE